MRAKAYIQMLALFLAGCAGADNGSYPSLARRLTEGDNIGSVSTPATESGLVEGALAGEVDGLTQKARSGAAAFDAGVPDAEKKVAAATGSAVSSEAWVAAQLAISMLESERYDSVFALASLDTLHVSRLNAIAEGKATGGMDMIGQARADALAIVDRQSDILDDLKRRLRTP